MTEQATPALGAMPPPDATIQIGDRADKLCVAEATDVFVRRTGYPVMFADMQAAIDAYLAVAAKHGWKLV